MWTWKFIVLIVINLTNGTADQMTLPSGGQLRFGPGGRADGGLIHRGNHVPGGGSFFVESSGYEGMFCGVGIATLFIEMLLVL